MSLIWGKGTLSGSSVSFQLKHVEKGVTFYSHKVNVPKKSIFFHLKSQWKEVALCRQLTNPHLQLSDGILGGEMLGFSDYES